MASSKAVCEEWERIDADGSGGLDGRWRGSRGGCVELPGTPRLPGAEGWGIGVEPEAEVVVSEVGCENMW